MSKSYLMIILRLKKSFTLRLTWERVSTPRISDWILVAASWARESSSSCIVIIMMINTIRSGGLEASIGFEKILELVILGWVVMVR